MEVFINYLGATQFEIQARSHTIICDQPLENGGFDEGITPPELLLAALGSCAAYYAVEYMKVNHLSVSGVRARVTAEKAKSPARLSWFRIELQVGERLDPRQREGVLRAVRKCLIHNTLLRSPEIHTEIAAPQREHSLAA